MKTIFTSFLLWVFLLPCVLPASGNAPVAEECKNDDTHLKILSWNIYMLPKMVVRKGKRARAYAIVEELKKSDFDVIVFQEAFLPAARQIIRKGLSEKYPYVFGPANNSPSIKTSSGVWVISSVPLRELGSIQFSDCATWDCLSRKGAMLLEGEWHEKKFQILGTHLQADQYTAIREKQMDQIYLELLSKFRKPEVPQIICGDLNTEADMKEHYCAMLDCLNAENGEISGVEKCTYDGVNNEIAQSYGAKSKTTYDYILVRGNGVKMNFIKRFVNVLRKGRRNLSDHYGVVCELKF